MWAGGGQQTSPTAIPLLSGPVPLSHPPTFPPHSYFNTYLNSECYPAVGAKPPSLGFPGSCPPTLPWSDPRLAAPPGCSPDQVALKWWGTAVGGPAVLVSWTTCTSSYVASGPVSPADPAAAPSVVRVGKVPGVYDTSFAGVAASYTMDYSQEYASASSFVLVPSNGGIYVSPIVHHTLIRGLVPGEEIFYLVEGPAGTTPFAGQFKVPGGSPTRVGIVSDSGQTANTSTTFDFLAVGKPDLLVIVGDLTYADNTGDWNMFYNWTQAAALSSDINTVRKLMVSCTRHAACVCCVPSDGLVVCVGSGGGARRRQPPPRFFDTPVFPSLSSRRAGTRSGACCPRWRLQSPS